MTLYAWLLLVPSLLLLSLIPGPNNLLSATNGMRFGIRIAAFAVAGRIAAFTLMIVVTIAGLGAVLNASEIAFRAVKWAGVAYLVWIGMQTWRAPPMLERSGGTGAPRSTMLQLARQELLVAIGNPKAILIFTAAFPQFVDPSRPAWPQLVSIGVTFLVIEWCVAFGYATAGRRLGVLKLGARWIRTPNRIFGGLFLGAAGLLALSRRTT